MKKIILTLVGIVAVSLSLMAQQDVPKVFKAADLNKRLIGFNTNKSVQFAKAELIKLGFKESKEEGNSFHLIIEINGKNGKPETMEVDIQGMEKASSGELAMVAQITKGNVKTVETLAGKTNLSIMNYKANRVKISNQSFELKSIPLKGGPSINYESEIEETFSFEPLQSTASALVKFWACLSAQVIRDCSSTCKSSILSCINTKKGAFARKISDIFGADISWWEGGVSVVKATIKFAGGLATCISSSSCGSCAAKQVWDCVDF